MSKPIEKASTEKKSDVLRKQERRIDKAELQRKYAIGKNIVDAFFPSTSFDETYKHLDLISNVLECAQSHGVEQMREMKAIISLAGTYAVHSKC